MPLEKLDGEAGSTGMTAYKTVLEPPAVKPFASCGHDFPESLCPYCKDEEIGSLRREVERLKSGRFSLEEFQNLCHQHPTTCTPDDVCAFVEGCRDYQVKLFGAANVRKALHRLWQEWTRKYACRECGGLPDPNGLIDHHRGCSKEGTVDRIDAVEP
jgi:hypothetical protein